MKAAAAPGGLVVLLIVIAGLMVMASAPVLNRLPWASSIAADVPKGDEWPLPHHDVKMTVFLGIGFAVALSTILAIWLVGLALAQVRRRIAPVVQAVPAAERHEGARQAQGRLVLFAAFTTTLGMGLSSTPRVLKSPSRERSRVNPAGTRFCVSTCS